MSDKYAALRLLIYGAMEIEDLADLVHQKLFRLLAAALCVVEEAERECPREWTPAMGPQRPLHIALQSFSYGVKLELDGPSEQEPER